MATLRLLSFFGLLAVVTSPIMWYFMANGHKWRQAKRERQEEEDAKTLQNDVEKAQRKCTGIENDKKNLWLTWILHTATHDSDPDITYLSLAYDGMEVSRRFCIDRLQKVLNCVIFHL